MIELNDQNNKLFNYIQIYPCSVRTQSICIFRSSLKLSWKVCFGVLNKSCKTLFGFPLKPMNRTRNHWKPFRHTQTHTHIHTQDKGGQMNHDMTHILHDKNSFLPSGYTHEFLEFKISRVKFNLSLPPCILNPWTESGEEMSQSATSTSATEGTH